MNDFIVSILQGAIRLQMASHLINELYSRKRFCSMFETESSEPVTHPPAACILAKCGKVRQGDIYS